MPERYTLRCLDSGRWIIIDHVDRMMACERSWSLLADARKRADELNDRGPADAKHDE